MLCSNKMSSIHAERNMQLNFIHQSHLMHVEIYHASLYACIIDIYIHGPLSFWRCKYDCNLQLERKDSIDLTGKLATNGELESFDPFRFGATFVVTPFHFLTCNLLDLSL